ncbi:RNA polymerase I associated factor [Ophiocordyceps camponoti-floridani]|uniref:RNA polymerase I associated factor n=1 Tax=Ophiocordyceps camponoti-floridani TaxID=2030778 RepID=A0A8H4VEH8_9HYPO|nr:RNA polymerase I associated factor [Ophiocordyceps camponoti-floridani]
MGEKSSKKRKRDVEPSSSEVSSSSEDESSSEASSSDEESSSQDSSSDDGSPKKAVKRVSFKDKPSTNNVPPLLRTGDCPPLIVTAPGIELSSSIALRCNPPRELKSGLRDDQELLFRSEQHPTLEYVAREEEPDGQHFLGIYDEKTGKMELVKARKIEVRVRSRDVAEVEYQDKSLEDRRTDLTQTFGTKKAKKAISEQTLETITPAKPGAKPTAAMKATIAAIKAATADMATPEQLQAAVASAKPVPKVNSEATTIEQAYDVEAIIGRDVLHLVPIHDWQEKARAGESVGTPSRFVSARLNNLAMDDSTMGHLRILRYLELLIRFYRTTKAASREGGRQLLPRSELGNALSPAPDAVIENIRRKFSNGTSMTKFHVQLLTTHCCLFALVIDGYETITQQLREDLRVVDDQTMKQFYLEIGATAKAVKVKGQRMQVATLALPLKFPKQRRVRR